METKKYTRKEAGLRSYFETTDIRLPLRTTNDEIKEYVKALSPAQQQACRKLYIQYMSIGRPDYIENHKHRHRNK